MRKIDQWYKMEEPPQSSDPFELRRYLQDEFLKIEACLDLLHIDGEWYDLLAPIVSAGRRGAASDFTWGAYDSVNIYQPVFAIGSDGMCVFHINHDIMVNSLMYPHVHWSTDGTDVNPVHWELNYKIAARNDESATDAVFGAEQTITLIGNGRSQSYCHTVTEVSDGATVTAPDVDSIIIMQVKRVTTGSASNADTVFGHFVDFHYRRERLGTKNKAPDFMAGRPGRRQRRRRSHGA